jgi:hypothetical protein
VKGRIALVGPVWICDGRVDVTPWTETYFVVVVAMLPLTGDVSVVVVPPWVVDVVVLGIVLVSPPNVVLVVVDVLVVDDVDDVVDDVVELHVHGDFTVVVVVHVLFVCCVVVVVPLQPWSIAPATAPVVWLEPALYAHT